MVEYARFDMIYIGIYSVRPGTYAARKYEDNIPKEVKHDRRNRLNELLKKILSDKKIIIMIDCMRNIFDTPLLLLSQLLIWSK